MTPQPLVSVCCMTYNHEKTIAQAIEGIICQQTDFPFELIIHDDASTDATPDIIRSYAERYPDIIRPILQKENQFHKCNIAERFLRPAIRGKYVAICEGDDYWTNTNKLQLQAECMESDPNRSLCFHAVTQLNSDGTKMTYRPFKGDGSVSDRLVVKMGGMFCPSVSLMYRRDVSDCWPQFRLMADVYDYPTQVLAATMGEVYYIDKIMGVYRFAAENSWTAEHTSVTDYRHTDNETHWMKLFDEYTDGRYKTDIDYHLAHMWFTEYRKSIDPEIKARAKGYISALCFKDKITFSVLFAAFTVFGKRANKMWYFLKKNLLK